MIYYFYNFLFDNVVYTCILNKINSVYQSSIDRDRKLLLEQLTVVSKKVFKLILERQSNCSVQLEHIIAVQVVTYHGFFSMLF